MTQLAEAFDTDITVITAYGDARKAFESWAGVDKDEFPADNIDAMQVALMRWQRTNFGDQIDERMAHGVSEEITETEIATSFEEAVDGLGDVCVYAGQLAMSNRLAIRPIFHLAAIFARDGLKDITNGQPHAPAARRLFTAQGMISQVVLKGQQKIRGLDDGDRYRIRLVGALASCIARCAAAVIATYKQDLSISETYILIGEEVSQRGQGHEAIPKLTVH